MLRLVVGLISLVALAFLLAEFFIVFLLPRRVNRDPAIARAILRTLWIPWRAGAGLLRREPADTLLGIFGPLGLVAILGLLSTVWSCATRGCYGPPPPMSAPPIRDRSALASTSVPGRS